MLRKAYLHCHNFLINNDKVIIPLIIQYLSFLVIVSMVTHVSKRGLSGDRLGTCFSV